ncbi:MAG TPA: hypothetical protein PLG15_05080 [Candidatus Gastranaerophilaceae bacterium]|nr:hypothetical protein [Candidatus Gastranaerophilaceae bacterium]HPT41737.1 hypothetical protein [Candidatus Gastranaerophilaceae bacterium]
MYVEIEENKLLSWCENPYLDYVYVDIDYATFEPEKYRVIDGILTDISHTQEYAQARIQEQREADIENLKTQIEEFDIKRIRAIAEPEVKDETTEQTWLEYYTQQIIDLRQQLAEL